MTASRADWTPQDILWELGATFIDATAETASATIQRSIERIGQLLECSAAGVWRVDPTTMTAVNVHSWAVDGGRTFNDGTSLSPSPAVRDAVLAGGGLAVVDLELVVGEDLCEARGWTGGKALVALVHQSTSETVVLVLGAPTDHWCDRDLELIRGTVLLLRQFNIRIQAEEQLFDRHRLDDLTVSLAARFQTVTAATVHDEVESALRQLREILDAESIVLIDVIDDATVNLPHMVAHVPLPDEWRTVPVPDISVLPGCEGMTIRDFVAEPRVMDVADIVDGLMGKEMSEALGLRNPPRTVALLPASVSEGDALVAVSRIGEQEWRTQEFDALSTLASLIAQTRGRVAAEAASLSLLEAQRALAATGQSFLQADAHSAPAAIEEALGRIARHLGAELAVITEIGEDNETVTVTDSWSGNDDLVVPAGTTMNRNAIPMINEMLVAETEVFVRDSTDDLAAPLRDSSAGKWSTVVAPIHGSAATSSALAFIFTSTIEVDPSAARDIANATADLVGQLQVRIRAELEVTARLRIDEQFSQIADDFLGLSGESANEGIAASLSVFAAALDLRGIALRRMVGVDNELEFAWAPAGKQRPPVGHSVDIQVPVERHGVESFDADNADSWSSVLESIWGPGVSIVAVPVMVAGEVESTLTFATTTGFADHELDAFRSLSAMLGQLRARLAEERRGQRRLEAQQLLGSCAQELAEASPDDFQERLDLVLARSAQFAGLRGLFFWQVDHLNERYVLRSSYVDGPVEFEPVDSALFGEPPLLDRVRLEGETRTMITGSSAFEDCARLAVPRGDGSRVDSVLQAASWTTEPFPDEVRELIEALSQTMQEVSARISAERYSLAAFEGAPIGVVLRDERLNLITCNQAFVDFVGADSVDDLVGTAPHFVYDDTYETIEWSAAPNGQLTAEAAFRGPEGARVWGQMRGSVVTGGNGEHFWLIHIEDVTERRRAEQLLRFQASHDELTGLANRRRLLDEIHRIADGSGSVGVLLLDLDRFKNINDSLGHDRGDELLVVVADRLRLAVRPGDLVARLGGDEFAVVLPGPVDVADAEFVAERLMSLIGEPVVLGRQKIYPTASIGIAVVDDSTEVDDLLRRADTAMYRAKAQGRARAESFDEKLREAVHARMATEAGLRHALRSDELIVYYQPEVALDDGRMLGAEALIRWDHPEKGILPAAAFIEIAEETGLVVEMGEIVLAQACEEAAAWPGGDSGPMIRVNLAAAQLQREDTVSLVRSVLAETGLAPHRLCLEITESAVMSDIHRSEEILQRLKSLGVHLAVDDFGTGFSSLAYLKRFPVDALKIDRAFVSDLSHDSEDVAFVRSIVSLAEALGLDVVAEGVETEEQAQILLDLGCLRAQGYYFARPGPASALRDHLAQLLI